MTRPVIRAKARRPDKRQDLPPVPLHKRSPRQLAFVDEYLVDLHAHHAALRAGYAESSAKAEGSRLLADPVLSEEIKRRMQVRANAAAISSADVVEQLRRVVLFDIADLVDPATNRLLPIHQIPKHVRLAMQGLELVTCFGEITAVKPVGASKAKHMELLMRHLGMLQPDKKDSGPTVQFDVHFHAPAAAEPPAKTVRGGKREPVTIEADGIVADFGAPALPVKRRAIA